jgi:hypothetical protein
LNNQWDIREIGNQKFLEMTENENVIYKSLWETAKAMLRGKFA